MRLSSGPAGPVEAVAELLLGVGSVSLPVTLTVAVLEIAVRKVAGALKVTTMAVVAPLASAPPVQLRVPEVIEQPLVDVVAFVTPVGSGSLNEKPVAALGPLSLTVNVSVMAPPGLAVVVAEALSPRSTGRVTVVLPDAELFAAVESVSVWATVALTCSAPAVAVWKATENCWAALGARVPEVGVQVTVEPLRVHAEELDPLTKFAPEGTGMVTLTPVAVLGPALAAATV